MSADDHATLAESFLEAGEIGLASVHAQLACFGLQKAAIDLATRSLTPPTKEELWEHFARVAAARRQVPREAHPPDEATA